MNTAQQQQPTSSSSSSSSVTGTQSGSVQFIDSKDDAVAELHLPVNHNDGGMLDVEQVQRTSDAN